MSNFEVVLEEVFNPWEIETKFAWLPKKTDLGWRWLTNIYVKSYKLTGTREYLSIPEESEFMRQVNAMRKKK